MTDLTALQSKQINVQIGKESINGILIDAGKEILVLFNGEQYMYIPLFHVHQIKLNRNKDELVDPPPSKSTVTAEMDPLSYQDVLTNAKGNFLEIYVARNLSFYGYITNVLNDYIAFDSPLYKTIYIPIHHIKWLIPYTQNITPYTLSKESLPFSKSPNNLPLLLSLENQLKKVEGKLVIFDGGMDPRKVGLLKKVENNLAEFVLATGEIVCINLLHIKSVHML
ncbi:DUF2642 domain-containing protein [Bacillus sp. FJAT-29790]|uniref:DUF2642 domain-containing protein n=1 Tax=Bacillus sp. FJAT-29790 TaxID=1895002 RepID=UPI001C2252EB|nr:DUF2642 domain-containing protein [Bacillus sp. FJAT-29790]MBU8877965.1 DUF2642 domain-containing protein [Bacillus sp. FJAT-29790]